MKLIRNKESQKYKGEINMYNVICYNKYANTYITKRSPHKDKFLFVGNSDDEFFDYLLECLYQKKQYNLMKYDKKRFTMSDVNNELRNRLYLVNRPTGNESENIWLTPSYSNGYLVELQLMLNRILAEIEGDSRLDIAINDYAHAVKQTMNHLTNIRRSKINATVFNPAPSYLILTPNGVFNNKTKQLEHFRDYNHYHFTKRLNFEIKSPDKISPLKREIVKRILDDWSDGDEEVKTLICQIAVAVIEGDGRSKTIILKSDGGGGKTSFLNILKAIVGASKILNCGIYELGNDNKLANLKLDTHAILGDDADTNKKMPAIALSRLKSLTDSGSFMIDVKYEASRNVATDALFIQNTNTDLAIYENNPALASRFVKLDWTNHDFRQDKDELEFDLKEMIGNPNKNQSPDVEFIEAFISEVIHSTKYFKSFTIPEKVKNATQEMLSENDQIHAYVEFLEDQGILNLPYLNSSTEYKRYVEWLHEQNPSAKPMKAKKFNLEFTTKLVNKGYIRLTNRKMPSSISKIDYNNQVINRMTDFNIVEKQRTHAYFFYNKNNLIKVDPDIKDVELDTNDPIDLQKIYYLIDECANVFIADKYSELMLE